MSVNEVELWSPQLLVLEASSSQQPRKSSFRLLKTPPSVGAHHLHWASALASWPTELQMKTLTETKARRKKPRKYEGHS